MYKENLTENYTETDTPSRLTVTTHKVAFAGLQYGDDNCWTVKDFGSNYFGDFKHRFLINISVCDSDASKVSRLFAGIVSAIDDLTDNIANGETQVGIEIWGTTSKCYIMLSEVSGSAITRDDGNKYELTLSTDYYIEITRISTTAYMNIYSDSDFNTLLSSTSLTVQNDTLRYYMPLQCIASTGTEAVTGHIQDIQLDPTPDPRKYIEAILDDLTLQKDDPTISASILVINEGGQEDMKRVFIEDDYDVLFEIHEPNRVTETRFVNDEPVTMKWNIPVRITTIDKHKYGSKTCTGREMLTKARYKMRDLIIANNRDRNYGLFTMLEPTNTSRKTGQQIYEITMNVAYEESVG